MYFNSISDFLSMGNHGLYVWMAYGFFVLIMVWILIDARHGRKVNLKKAQRVWMREGVSSSERISETAPGESS